MRFAVKLFLSLMLVFTVFSPLNSNLNEASAAGKTEKICTGSGFSKKCTTYKVYHYSYYWNKSSVEKIVKKYEEKYDEKTAIELALDLLNKPNPVEVGKAFYYIGYTNVITDFRTGKTKKKGMEIQYDMYVPQTGPNIVLTKNYKKTYK